MRSLATHTGAAHGTVRLQLGHSLVGTGALPSARVHQARREMTSRARAMCCDGVDHVVENNARPVGLQVGEALAAGRQLIRAHDIIDNE